MKNVSVIIILLIGLTSCNSNNQFIKTEKNKKKKTDLKTDIWINSNYINCMKIPDISKCVSINEPLVFYFSMDSSYINISDNWESGFYKLEKINDSCFNILNFLDSKSENPKLMIKTDRIEISTNENNIMFYEPNSFNLGELKMEEFSLVSEINARLLKDYIKKNDAYIYKRIFNDLIDDFSYFVPRNFDGINVLSEVGNCKTELIFEFTPKVINIYKYLNSCDDLNIDHKVEKELLYSMAIGNVSN